MSSEKKIENESPLNVISVDMDDRAFLIPEGRNIVQLKFSAQQGGAILIEFVYAHNVSRLQPSIITLQYADAKGFLLRMVDAVYRAQTQHAVSESAQIAITMVANGYIFIIDEGGMQRQFYMSSGVIWRVCNALCRIIDMQSPVASH